MFRDWAFLEQFRDMDVEYQPLVEGVMLASMSTFESFLTYMIKDNQQQDPELARVFQHNAKRPDFKIADGVFYFRDRFCVRDIEDLKIEITMEAPHHTRYSIHPGSTKMYQNLKGHFWWNN